MPEVFVEKIKNFAEGDRRIVFHDGSEIGVFHWQGEFYAYENLCVHQGGPCCEGVIMHKVEDVLGPDKIWIGQKFSADEAHFVCPWHGYEYDIKTGECAGNRSLRLKSYPVVRRGADLYVITG
jgi:nitrite reductase/ring-hydroxylating ferredoxin subunit